MPIDENNAGRSVFEAAEKGDLDRVKFLIETKEVSVNEINYSYRGYSILHHATIAGQKEIVAFLLSRENINVDIKEEGYLKFTPLHFAISEGNSTITELLLKKGANPNKKDCLYLHQAAQLDKNGEIIKQLLKKGVNVNTITYYSVYGEGTALHTALLNRNPVAISLLYPVTNPDLKNREAYTPIQVFIRRFDYLLSNNDVKDFSCLYAFLLAGAEIHEDLVSQQRNSEELIKVFQEAKKFVEAIQKKYSTLGPEIIQCLLFADPDERSSIIHDQKVLATLGYHSVPVMRNFLLASSEERKEFIAYRKNLDIPVKSKENDFKYYQLLNRALTLPEELRQIILEHLMIAIVTSHNTKKLQIKPIGATETATMNHSLRIGL